MMLLKGHVKKGKSYCRRMWLVASFLACLLSCIIAVLWWDSALYQSRGYSWLTPHPAAPYARSLRVLSQARAVFANGSETRAWKWLSPYELAERMSAITLPEEQPYQKDGIYLLQSKNISQRFLYSPIKLIDQDRLVQVQDSFPTSFKDEDDYFHARGISLVMLCPFAERKKANNQYCPYKQYPPSVEKHISVRALQQWCLIYYSDGIGLVYDIYSDIPPVPGCFVYIDMMNPENNAFYYPLELLPTVKAVYPELRIPQKAILQRH